MRRRVTRRTALALIGGTALAGCSAIGDDRFWDDPPPFDDAELGSVTRRSVPRRPDPIPITIDDAQREGFEDRVGTLLEPVPAPLTAGTLPNGAIRSAIASNRADAREVIDRMVGASDTLSRANAASDAAEHAATAAGIWAAVTVTGSRGDVTTSASDLSGRARRLRADLPGGAAGPEEGAVVYGSIGEWLADARRQTLARRPSVDEQPDPLRAGRVVGDLERIRTEIEAGDHVRARYVGSLDRPRPVGAALTSAVDGLAPRTKARFERFHDDDTERLRLRAPDVDDPVDRRYRQDEPGVRLLAEKVYGFFDEVPYEPIAWPEADADHPGLRVRNTYWALTVLEAIDDLRARVEDGDDLFPPDAVTVREARSRAIDAVADLGRSGSPLERWMAWRLVPGFDGPDETVESATGSDRREIADAYGEYVWLETVARAATETTETVTAALDG